MTIKEREKQIRLFAALVVALSMILIMVLSNKADAQTDKKYHEKLQKEYNYDARLCKSIGVDHDFIKGNLPFESGPLKIQEIDLDEKLF